MKKQPKKKNRKRVAERLAAQEAEKNAEENKTEYNYIYTEFFKKDNEMILRNYVYKKDESLNKVIENKYSENFFSVTGSKESIKCLSIKSPHSLFSFLSSSSLAVKALQRRC